MNHYIKCQQTNRTQSLFLECFEKKKSKKLPAVTMMEKKKKKKKVAGAQCSRITDCNISRCVTCRSQDLRTLLVQN